MKTTNHLTRFMKAGNEFLAGTATRKL